MVQVDYTAYWLFVGGVAWLTAVFALCAVILAARSDAADAKRRAERKPRAPRKAKEPGTVPGE